MPNIKSAKKRVIVAEIRRQKNASAISAMKTAIKKYETAVQAKDENSKQLLIDAISIIDKTAQKGIIAKNAASRQKSRLTREYNIFMA